MPLFPFEKPVPSLCPCRLLKSARRALCRHAGVNRSHFAHAELLDLAFRRDREQYEELRAAYNPVRPVGYSPAPPFEEWRGMSDICDHAYCRYYEVLAETCTKHHYFEGLLHVQ